MPPDDPFILPDKPAPKPGPFGRFYLQELINSGGMADIWLATDAEGRPQNVKKAGESKAAYHEVRAITKFVHSFAPQFQI